MGSRARAGAAGDPGSAARTKYPGSARRSGTGTGSTRGSSAAAPSAETAPADPLLAYLNSTPAAPVEPEAPAEDAAKADGEHYSLDDILAEFSDF